MDEPADYGASIVTSRCLANGGIRVVVKVGINGMGRIGRSFWRVSRTRPDIQVIAVNDVADAATLAHLLRYDSIRGRLDCAVTAAPDAITVDGERLRMLQRPAPTAVPWGDLGVDVVLESTGRFFRADQVAGHLAGGARRVLISAAAPDPDVTIIMGVNDDVFDPRRHRVVSPACCTSTAVAPLLTVLRQEFGVLEAHLTTIHAYDSTASTLHDTPYRSLRMGRAGVVNMVPSPIKDTTRALERVFPDLDGRVGGLAMRVPAAIGCAADLVVRLAVRATSAQVNAAFAAAASGGLKGHLRYTEEPLVSADIIGCPESSIVDGTLTTVVGDTVKALAWYDNEWGFANRLADVVAHIGSQP
jgi:glyceraldehyde 3-phosphate dehydrogenase